MMILILLLFPCHNYSLTANPSVDTYEQKQTHLQIRSKFEANYTNHLHCTKVQK